MENHPKCPRCGAVQLRLVLRKGRLYATDCEIIGYICGKCGKPVHHGARQKTKPLQKQNERAMLVFAAEIKP